MRVILIHHRFLRHKKNLLISFSSVSVFSTDEESQYVEAQRHSYQKLDGYQKRERNCLGKSGSLRRDIVTGEAMRSEKIFMVGRLAIRNIFVIAFFSKCQFRLSILHGR